MLWGSDILQQHQGMSEKYIYSRVHNCTETCRGSTHSKRTHNDHPKQLFSQSFIADKDFHYEINWSTNNVRRKRHKIQWQIIWKQGRAHICGSYTIGRGALYTKRTLLNLRKKI